jgi:hypothetical protein
VILWKPSMREQLVPGLKPNGENNLAFQDWNQTVRIIWRSRIETKRWEYGEFIDWSSRCVAPHQNWEWSDVTGSRSFVALTSPKPFACGFSCTRILRKKSVSRVEQHLMHVGTRTYCSPSWDIVAFLRKKDGEASSGGCVLVEFTTLHRRRSYNNRR